VGSLRDRAGARRARFAGSWYPGEEAGLRSAVESYLAGGPAEGRALGLMAPHAGYVYSGRIAGRAFAAAEVTESVIVLSPKHTRAGADVAVWDGGAWETPLGEVRIDEALSRAILERAPSARADRAAHSDEHSLELMLPFLKVKRPDVKIAAVAVGHVGVGRLRELGEACAKAQALAPASGALIVASSDMTHYEPAPAAKESDALALDRFVALDPEGLYETVAREGISMCGVAPVTAMLFACVVLGGARAEVVAYGTSGDVTGDATSVVGYAAAVVRP
jgi:hypothetical protein